MAEVYLPRHFNITVPLAGTWVYQDLYLDLKSETDRIQVPRSVIITNEESTNMYVKLLPDSNNGSEDADIGVLVKAGGQIELTSLGNNYKIGVRFSAATGANGECIVSALSYTDMIDPN